MRWSLEAQLRSPQGQATLDLDATLVQTWKEIARYGYQGYKAYQPLNVWWAEHELMLHSEFRDGNVPANFDNLRVLLEALERLPKGIRGSGASSSRSAFPWTRSSRRRWRR